MGLYAHLQSSKKLWSKFGVSVISRLGGVLLTRLALPDWPYGINILQDRSETKPIDFGVKFKFKFKIIY